MGGRAGRRNVVRIKPGNGILCVASLIACSATIHGQGPVIFPGGLVNAASYTAGGVTGNGIAPGSIAVLFGARLATDTWVPDPLLFPTQLGGTNVKVGGIAAHLIYVSPDQIDFQMPVSVSGATSVVVSTAAGPSMPYPINAVDAFGVFTRQAGGCGPAAAMNTAPDGTLSLNTPLNSASPGDVLAIFGTGLFPVSPAPPDGVPAPSSPLGTYTGAAGGTVFDTNGPSSPNAFVGAAAGLVGTDQVNVPVPDGAREGCAVPLRISTGESGNTRPVTVSIHQGGGPCSDPPPAGYGQIQWLKTLTTGNGPVTETNTVAISLQASPGKRQPPARTLENGGLSGGFILLGPECPVPGYRSLSAGTVTVQGPGFGPAEAAPAQLGPPEDGQIQGLSEYLAVLPPGAIQPGSFRVSAAGGVDVSAFQADLQIGAGVLITTPLLPGSVLDRQAPMVVNWTGGDAGAWVTLKVVAHHGTYDQYWTTQAKASDGSIAMGSEALAGMPAGPIEIDLEVEPENRGPLTVAGLSLGGEHSWKYVYQFVGLTLD